MISKGISADEKRITINLVAKVQKSDSCEGCYFEEVGPCGRSKCSAFERKDKKNIIWVEKLLTRPTK